MGKKDRKQRQREANRGAGTKGSQPRSSDKGKPTEEREQKKANRGAAGTQPHGLGLRQLGCRT